MDFAVIFDMDGVLVFNNTFHELAWVQFARKYGFDFNNESVKNLFGSTNRDYLTNLFGPLTEERMHELAEEKEALYRELYKPHIKAPDGLIEFLEELQNNEVPLAVATSAPPSNVGFVLSELGITKYFSVIVDDSQITRGKPFPDIYLLTAQKLGLKPDQCVVVEDSVAGVQAGINAGMKVVGITSTFSREQISHATTLIASYREVNVEKVKDLIKS